ncbi:MAG: SUMF1/EgtB/PvdO family nonheme iron enzyme [Pseudomonadota bacterium]
MLCRLMTGWQRPRSRACGGEGSRGWVRRKHPAINVGWDDATAYCVWLSEATALPSAERGAVGVCLPCGHGDTL